MCGYCCRYDNKSIAFIDRIYCIDLLCLLLMNGVTLIYEGNKKKTRSFYAAGLSF
ncbi:hypothetical protein AD31_3131 [Escherichia coli 2-427-07_S4_C3]|uniref:Uncharacterized protein n=1 Tax=Escherichia coli 2-460-02_S1_C1 TaxID=1444044 RepID=A0A836NCB8_ECOLX|nr:hypothetical protein AD31_3131 [Escherichia coli 2-427-07_S4_C3]KEO29205.1 hypothetical protein AB05_3110 [Escherichia coli 2-460-02_S1_C1]